MLDPAVGKGRFDPVTGEVTNVTHGLVSLCEFTSPVVICQAGFVRDISGRRRIIRGGGIEKQETLAELYGNVHLGSAHKYLAEVHEAV